MIAFWRRSSRRNRAAKQEARRDLAREQAVVSCPSCLHCICGLSERDTPACVLQIQQRSSEATLGHLLLAAVQIVASAVLRATRESTLVPLEQLHCLVPRFGRGAGVGGWACSGSSHLGHAKGAV